MNRYARFNVFGIAYGIAYMVFFFLNEFRQWSLFGYYPVLGEFSRERLPLASAGPAILWYSWLVCALPISLVLAFLTPTSVAERLGRRWVWIAPVALLILIFVYERRWFY